MNARNPAPAADVEPAAFEVPAATPGCVVMVVGPVAENNGADVAPAIVTRAWAADLINVTVLPDGYLPRHATSVRLYADEAGARKSLEGWPTSAAAYWPARG